MTRPRLGLLVFSLHHQGLDPLGHLGQKRAQGIEHGPRWHGWLRGRREVVPTHLRGRGGVDLRGRDPGGAHPRREAVLVGEVARVAGGEALVDRLGHVERLREPAVPGGEDQPVASGDERAVRDGDAPHHSGIVHDVCRDAGRRQEAPSSIFPHS